jgi:hypothetical protein
VDYNGIHAGKLLGDCNESLTDQQKHLTGADLADVMFALYQITALQCGSLRLLKSGLHDYQDDQSLRQRTLRYYIHSPGITLCSNQPCTHVLQEHLSIGPINDITFLDYPRKLLPHVCGPFKYATLDEAFAFLGKPPTRKGISGF